MCLLNKSNLNLIFKKAKKNVKERYPLTITFMILIHAITAWKHMDCHESKMPPSVVLSFNEDML